MNLSFSRKMLWLHVGATSHDPSVILYHYLQFVEKRRVSMIEPQSKFSVVVHAVVKASMDNEGYMELVHYIVGCPRVVHMDRGIEDEKTAAVQYAFHAHHKMS